MASQISPALEPHDRPVLLVIVGALGDWAVRRILEHAKLFAAEYARPGDDRKWVVADVVLIDQRERGDAAKWIARRQIEQSAEGLDNPNYELGEIPLDYSILRDPCASSTPGGGLSILASGARLPDPTVAAGPDPQVAIDDYKHRWVPEPDDAEIKRQLRGNPSAVSGVMANLQQKVVKARADIQTKFGDLTGWVLNFLDPRVLSALTPPAGVTQVSRYWRSGSKPVSPFYAVAKDNQPFEIHDQHLAELAKTHRIIVYAATPPAAYISIVRRWSKFAYRIALEKPIAGLLNPDSSGSILELAATPSDIFQQIEGIRTDTSTNVAGRFPLWGWWTRPRGIRTDASINVARRSFGLPPVEVVTIDHYNSKWAVQAIDFVKRHEIAELTWKKPSRVVIRVHESEILPRGRFYFYNGVGGALSDMLSHLLQPLRAAAGYAGVAELLRDLRVDSITRARYDVKDGSDGILDPRAPAFAGTYLDVNARDKMFADTETFGCIQATFKAGRWAGTPVEIRTGKGIIPKSKELVLSGTDSGHGRDFLVFDIDKGRVLLRGRADGQDDRVLFESSKIRIPGIDGRPMFPDAKEFVEVFRGLCGIRAPDPRFFPPVNEAVEVFEFFRKILVTERMISGINNRYLAYDLSYSTCAARPPYQSGPCTRDCFPIKSILTHGLMSTQPAMESQS